MATVPSNKIDPEQQFLRAFGEALSRFMEQKGYQQTQIVDKLGLESKQKLNSYLVDRKDGTRVRVPFYMFYLLCTNLSGFYFDHDGYRVSVKRLKPDLNSKPEGSKQLTMQFDRSFALREDGGTLRVRMKRPPDRLELSVSIDAKAS